MGTLPDCPAAGVIRVTHGRTATVKLVVALIGYKFASPA